jgi:holo-[acyl-carrier protein] synthase
MVFGVGIDLVEIRRIEKSIARFGDRFLGRVFSDAEISYCKDKPRSYLHFAACFAVKEAFLKALGAGLGGGFALPEIETIHDALGKPFLRLSGRATKFLDSLGVDTTLASISHSGDYATAVVILAKEKGLHGSE